MTHAKPLPRIDETNAGHWQGAREGRLRVQRCDDCGQLRYPPSRWCPACLSEASDWVDTSGQGKVWSWCVFHRAYFKGFEAELPYVVVLVELAECIKVYSNLMDVDRADLRIGMNVHAVFERATDEVTLVKFARDV